MSQSKSKFDVANLTEDEKKQRGEGIEFLFNELHNRDAGSTRVEAEQFYDKMQQAAIDSGVSSWTFYRTK